MVKIWLRFLSLFKNSGPKSHWKPESPYEVLPPPERNKNYGVDL